MSGNTTSLYSTSSSNGTTGSNNFTTLYPSQQGVIIPTTPYGNANVVALLAAGTDGSNTVANVSATGNVTANYFIGNGSQLTGIVSSTYGNAQVAAYLSSGTVTSNIITSGNITGGNLLTTGVVSATGNITTAGYFLGTFAGNISGNLTVPGSNTQVLYNNNGNAGASTGFTFDSASNVATVAGNIVGGNISTAGNITGNYILGNGSQLTGLPANYGNANVATFLASFGSNTISTTGTVTAGNVTGAYFIGNGSQLTGIVSSTYGNAQVAAYLSSGTVTSNIITTGDVTGANLNTTSGYVKASSSDLRLYPAVGSNVVIQAGVGGANLSVNGNITGSNILTGGVVSAAGNITGNYILGNGALLTGIAGTYSNADVTSLLANFGSNTVSTTGNVTAGYFLGNGSQLTGVTATVVGTLASLSVTGNTQTGNLFTGGAVSATGNVTGNYFIGNIVGNISMPGSNTEVIYNNNGNAGANYNFTYNSATNLLTVNGGQIQAGNFNAGSGIIQALTGNLIDVNSTTVSASGNVTANYFIGNGSQLTGIAASTVNANALVGNTLSANVLNSSLVSVGNLNGLSVIGNVNTANVLATGIVSAAGNITGNYILGNGSQLTGIVPTTVGTLASLSVTGNTQTGNLLTGGAVSATGNITGNYFLGNGSQLTGVTASSVAASALTGDTLSSNVIYSSLQVTAPLLYQSVIGNITTSNNIFATGFVSATGNVRGNVISGDTISTGGTVSAAGNITTAGFFIGNGSQLTGVTVPIGGNVSANINMLGYNIFDSTRSNVWINDGLSVTGQILGSGLISAAGSVIGSDLTAGSAGTGNITGGNLSLSGLANVNTLVTYGNAEIGSQLSVTGGISAPGSAINAASLSVTGNIRGGGGGSVLNMNGGDLRNIGGTAGSDAIQLNGNLSFSGGNINLPAGLISASGNITGNYFIGNGSLLTGISGGGSYGNTEVAAFLPTYTGNLVSLTGPIVTSANVTGANLRTFGQASVAGNITAANVLSYYTSNGTIITSTVASNVNATVNPYRIVYGNGYRGDYSSNADPLTFNRGSQLAVIGTQVLANADTNNAARLLTSSFFIDLNQGANITNTSKRYSGIGAFALVGNGNITLTAASGTNVGAVLNGGTQTLVIGNSSSVQMGNASVSHAAAINSTFGAAGGGTVGNAAGSLVTLQNLSANSTFTTSEIGYTVQFLGTSGTVAGNVIGYYMPSNVATTYGWNSTNQARAATNYYFLKNDDAVAQNQLGSLRAYHTYQYPSGTTGTVDVDKNNGQIQLIAPTGNITIGNFTNFVTTANDGTNNDTQSDTVTLIIQQGATPYTITMPTGNSSIKYAGGTSTVANTANAVTTITVQAFRSSANASMYLTTISPEFS